MAMEIERKFLVCGGGWKAAPGVAYRQGYVCRSVECTVRVRVAGGKGYLTVKGESTGASRAEFQYEIPHADAVAMLASLVQTPLIEKMRHTLEYQGFTWEVDVFAGENSGLIVAEIELESESQSFPKPDWVGEEVTDDARYYNANLVSHPYRMWK